MPCDKGAYVRGKSIGLTFVFQCTSRAGSKFRCLPDTEFGPQTLSCSSAVFPLFRISYLWYVPLSLLVGVTLAGLAAALGWREDLALVDPKLVSPLARRLLPPPSVAAARPRPSATAAEQALLLADLRVRALD